MWNFEENHLSHLATGRRSLPQAVAASAEATEPTLQTRQLCSVSLLKADVAMLVISAKGRELEAALKEAHGWQRSHRDFMRRE